MRLQALIPLVLSVCALTSSVATTSDATQAFTIPSGKNLHLTIPPELRWESAADDKGSVTIKIRPQDGSFEHLISTLPLLDKQTADMMDENMMAYLLVTRAKELLDRSVEKEIKLEKLEGAHGAAFYYCLTDAREVLPEGEFRNMCQGFVVLKRLRLTFTVLMNQRKPETIDLALDIVRSAKYR